MNADLEEQLMLDLQIVNHLDHRANHLLVDTNENIMMVDRVRKDSSGVWGNRDIDK